MCLTDSHVVHDHEHMLRARPLSRSVIDLTMCAYMCATYAVSHMDAKLHFNSIDAAALIPLPRRPSDMCFAEPLRPRSVTRNGARLSTTVGEPQKAQIPVYIGT